MDEKRNNNIFASFVGNTDASYFLGLFAVVFILFVLFFLQFSTHKTYINAYMNRMERIELQNMKMHKKIMQIYRNDNAKPKMTTQYTTAKRQTFK